jgi:glycosyltransferase involved in cell wall biosynthesis
MPIISIIVPIYNVEKYIHRCLDSVIVQTFTDYECILVDDGSPDNCPAICDEYAVKDTQFSVIHKENGGLSDARNVGIQAAIGEYIVLLDSDDLFAANDALQNLVKVIQQTRAPVVFNSNLTTVIQENYSSYDGFEKHGNNYAPDIFYKEIMHSRKILLAGWLFTVKRDFLLQYNLLFKKGILHEDEHWMPRVICAAEYIAINHNLFYSYRKEREGSIMTDVSPKRLFDALGIMKDFLQKEIVQSKKAYKFIYRDRCKCLWYGIFYSLFLIDEFGEQYSEEKRKIEKELKRYAYLLLVYGKRIQDIIYFLLIELAGIKFAKYIQITIARVKDYARNFNHSSCL